MQAPSEQESTALPEAGSRVSLAMHVRIERRYIVSIDDADGDEATGQLARPTAGRPTFGVRREELTRLSPLCKRACIAVGTGSTGRPHG